MWCKSCCRETNKDKCEICDRSTEQEVPLEVFWCSECKVPLIKHANSIDRDVCPICGGQSSYLCADLRPVFPEERLLLEVLQGKPLAYIEKSVWASNNRYYIDGKPLTISLKVYKNQIAADIRKQLEQYAPQNSSCFFEENIKKFVSLNQLRLRWVCK